MERGEVWWADLPDATGSEPGGRRPVLVVQANPFNRSAIRTVIVAVMTSRLERAAAPGNVLVTSTQSGLPKDSVVNVSQIFTVDREVLTNKVGNISTRVVRKIDDGLRRILAL